MFGAWFVQHLPRGGERMGLRPVQMASRLTTSPSSSVGAPGPQRPPVEALSRAGADVVLPSLQQPMPGLEWAWTTG
jgi:hypothetical protein